VARHRFDDRPQRGVEEDVKAFFRLYYAPNNATLASSATSIRSSKELIAQYFRRLAAGQDVQRPSCAGQTRRAKRLVYEDRVQVPRLYIQWPTSDSSDDDYPLSVMSSICSGSRTARLTKALVYDSQTRFARWLRFKTRRKTSACFR
jgi:zinc protease